MSKYPAPHEGLEEADWGFSSSGMRLSVGVVHNAASDGVEANAWASEEGWNTATALTSKAESESLSVQSAVQAPGYDFGVGDDEDDGSGSQHSVSVAEAPSSSPLEVTKEREQRQPVITKSHQLNHITSIFNDSQKIAYVGLCYLIITSMRARYQRNVDLSAQSYSKTPNVKSTLAAFSAWSEHFMNMLYAFVDVSNEEQTMIVNLATHGLMPTDLSKGLIDDAQRALERLQKMQAEEAWIKQQEAKWIESSATPITPIPATSNEEPPQISPSKSTADISDIRYTILSHLFILCICDGLYDTRSRTLLRAVAAELQISWWDLARLEDTIGEQLRRQGDEGGDVAGASGHGGDVKPEEKTVRERNAKDSKGRWLYMGLATLAGGAVIGLTAGFAAPIIASGITAAMTTFHVAGGVGAGVAAAMGGTTGIAIIASSGSAIGGGLTGYKMHRRTKGIEEFEFVALSAALTAIATNKRRRDERDKKKKAKAAAEEKERERNERERIAREQREKQNSGWLGGEHAVEQATSPTSTVAGEVALITLANDSTPPSAGGALSPNVAVGRKGSFIQPGGGMAVRAGSRDRRESLTPSMSSDRVSRDVPPAPILFSDGASAAGKDEDASPVTAPKANVLITIAGWVGPTDSRDDFTLPFSTLTPGLHGDQYALVWETQALIELGHAVKLLMSEVTSFVVQQGIQYFLLPVLMAGLTGPMWAIKLTYMVDNPWGNGLTKAKKAGRLLADTLLSRVQGNRPATLVGFSLGARVIYYCLLELASRGEAAYGLVEEAYLFGTPVMATTKEWRQIAGVVSGRVVNGYMTNDWVLSILYRASSALFSDVAGLNPVKNVEGVENVCLDGVLKGGHLEYRAAMPRILKHVGFSVEDEFFDDGEKEAEMERLEAEAEKERLKNEKEEAAKRRLAELEEKARKAKEEEEFRRAEYAAKKVQQLKLQQEQQKTRRSWWGSSKNVSASGSTPSIAEDLPFEIKEIKSTMPPLVLTLDDAKGQAPPHVNSDGSLI